MLIAWLVAAVVTPVGLAAPDRLTAGPANQYLGAAAPAPDGRGGELYFTSDEESTTQIYVQELGTGVPRLAFDELADVTWPRPSPDGRHLLYISYREDAAGDLCVREIQGRPGARIFGERRCLTGPDSAELQAVWFPNSLAIAVVTRPGLHGDFELRKVSLDGALGERLTQGSTSTPSISPDGRWLASVPVQRASREVGPSFLGRSAGALELRALGGGEPRAVRFELPGATAMPAFSRDGAWLYFTQFLNDTNFDGAIDGNDHGVLFRAPFSGGAVGAPEQLSSARWSCQYPDPTAARLLATCLQDGSLDVFSLPPAGAIPPEWSASGQTLTERIDDELSASRDRWERLLLLAHRGATPDVLREIVRLHLELGEYESARFYAAKLEEREPETGAVLRELAEQRRAERALARGSLSVPFVVEARARLTRLAGPRPLAVVARSEILDTLGEEDAARAVLAPLAKLDGEDELVAALYADRLQALYRDDPRYLELYRPIAEEHLEHAEAFVAELLRGAARTARAPRLETWLRRVDPYSELAFLLQLELALADLTAETQEQVRERVFSLYRKNKDLARRKALVGATVRRALAADNDYLLYNFAESWVSYVPRERAERRRAERLYRDAVFERAYVEEARGERGDARGHFFGVTLQTDSLEAHAGFLEMRFAEGVDPRKDYPGTFSPAVNGYVRAYLAARRLPELFATPAAHQRADQEAIRELSALAQVAPQRAEVHQLWGYVAHQRFLRTGDRLAAVEANAHDLLALDLARDNPRLRAAVLDALGRLQSSVGNYGLALGWLEQRGKLPFASPVAQLSHCLALARARYHTSEFAVAADESERCLALTSDDAADGKALARFRPLALDRSALYQLAAGRAKLAAERYAELWPVVDRAAPAPAARAEAARNRLTTRLGQASAALALGRPEEALTFVAAAEALLAAGPPAPRDGAFGRERPVEPVPAQSYQVLLWGLRAQSHALAGDTAAAERALTARRDGLAKRYRSAELDEDLLDLALCEAQLAKLTRARPAAALAHLKAARAHWRTWSENTGTPHEDTGLAILAAFADLHLTAGVPLAELGFDLAAELASSYTQLSELRNPAWEPMRDRLALYLTTLDLRSHR
ncbi:MAG: hypothetical protein R3B48_22630 [Kofleriaceae bacterium]